MWLTHKLQTHVKAGFSLIEVTLSLGIIAFALLAIMGLLPVGLSTTQQAGEQARAARLMQAASACIQSANATGPAGSPAVYTYRALAPFDSLEWSVAVPTGTQASAPSPIFREILIGAEDLPVTTRDKAQFYMHVAIHPPPDRLRTGRANIVIAWPGVAVTKNSATAAGIPNLSNFTGYVDSTIYFTPQ